MAPTVCGAIAGNHTEGDTIMRTETINIFTFDELDETGKERARDWWRECKAQDWHGSEFVFEDAERIAEILGIEFDTKQCSRPESKIYYSGFSSQGDGACFEGSYDYKPGSCKAIREYAPTDKTLHNIADTLRDVQRRYFYQLHAQCRHFGHHYHSGCMAVTVEDTSDTWRDVSDDDTVIQAMRGFADWIYSRLESEYEFTMSAENVDESIRANEYEFTEDGTVA
jgi:hypothetical protein